MNYSKQKKRNADKNRNLLQRLDNSKSAIKKRKRGKFASKKQSRTIESILMPTSSSTFKCEPIKKLHKILSNTELHSLKEAKEEKKRNVKFEPKGSKLKPYIVKMKRPSNYNPDLIKIFDDKRPPEHFDPDVNLLKILVSGCPETSHMEIDVSSNKVFPKKVQVEKLKTAKREKNYEKSSLQQTNLTKEVNNQMTSENNNSNKSSDYFVINSSNNCNDQIAKVYKISDSKYLLSMTPGRQLYFVGIFDIELLRGNLEILGYCINEPLEKLVTVFSSQGSSHLFIKASSIKSDSVEDMKEKWLRKLLSLGLPMATSQKILKETEKSVVFALSRNSNVIQSTVWPMFLDNHLSFSLFPLLDLLRNESKQCHNVMERNIGCICQENLRDLGYKEFIEVPEWSLIEENMLSKDVFKAVLCGGKSVGKSTLLRYLVNKCLQKWDNVLVVDCDLGQCEFTPPGCVSVTLVDQPLLGPNYSHLKEPLRCVYLGEVDVTKCPESYMKGYKWLIDYAKQEHGNTPWLINTMGFTKGFGVMVACDIIKIVKPSQVIQIQSKDRKLNFPQRLEPGYVYSKDTEAFSGRPEPLDFKLCVIPSGSESGTAIKSRGISPAESRNLVILSYLSGMLSSAVLSLSQLMPYRVNMDLLELQMTNKYSLNKAQIAATMNGNLVALSSLNASDLFPNCLGFGIVRGIDWQTNTIYLITPLPASSLSKVNCLQKGNIALPESLYFNQGAVEGRVPYLAFTSGNATARFAKRDFRSLPATATSSGTSF